jgi:hypothetical protein
MRPIARQPPADVKRQLRREAGFGCCVCGRPIIQYHHIVEWAEEQHFRPEDMMVLCPLHHDKATDQAMPEAEQRRYKIKPFNIANGLVHGKLALKQDYCAVDIGDVTVVGEGTFMRIDGEEMLALYMGEQNFELSVTLYDQADCLALHIDHNEWISGDPLPWDIEADWQRLTLRERHRKILLSLDAKKVPMRLTAEFWRSGKFLKLGTSGISAGGKTFTQGAGIKNLAIVGLSLDVQTGKLAMSVSGRGEIVSWPHPRERLWRARDAWRRVQQHPLRNIP